MNKNGKDSTEVVEFMTLFARLKDSCNDVPEKLIDFAREDPSIRDLCEKLAFKIFLVKMDERRRKVLVAAPVNPSFVIAWREYEERYDSFVGPLLIPEIVLDLGLAERSPTPEPDLPWYEADREADEQSRQIEEVFGVADLSPSRADLLLGLSQEEYEQVQQGIAAWHSLKEDTGFDLRGIFRHRALVPSVLVPRQVAAKYGASEKLSMLKNLHQAHDAFVYGASYAALALMRSIAEAVLRDHYGAEGNDLSERIRNARRRLPRGANETALHRLRKLANAVLHLDREKDEGLPSMDDKRLEKEIVSLLFVLRALIEGVN